MIAVEGVTKRFGDTVALSDVSCEIADGEFVLVVGANGSGKSTLVRHCNALVEPDEGTVTVDGTDVTVDPVAARTSVGMVFQHPRDQFVAATVGADVAFGPENLGLERAEIDRRVADALEATGMAGRERERIATLSGGEQARVAIAGALAMEPTHLVLDEPFAGLDRDGKRAVRSRLDELAAEGTSVVVVTHDLRGVWNRADRVLALEDGRLVADGAPEAVRTDLDGLAVDPPEGC